MCSPPADMPRSSFEGEQVWFPGCRGRNAYPNAVKTRLVSCANVADAQVDLDGRIHPELLPTGDAWPWRLIYLSGSCTVRRMLADAFNMRHMSGSRVSAIRRTRTGGPSGARNHRWQNKNRIFTVQGPSVTIAAVCQRAAPTRS